MIQIKKFTFNPVAVNAYLLWDETGEAVLIDPACYYADEEDELAYFIERQSLTITGLLNTHGHFDHLMGNGFASEKWNLRYKIHSGDAHMPGQAKQYATLFGITMKNPPEEMEILREDDIIEFGNSELKVIHVPGHSPGSVAFYGKEDKILIAGDIIFEGSVGRTDLPGGNQDLLISGIMEKLMVLEKDVKIFPGHGGSTTVGMEKRTNPFLR